VSVRVLAVRHHLANLLGLRLEQLDLLFTEFALFALHPHRERIAVRADPVRMVDGLRGILACLHDAGDATLHDRGRNRVSRLRHLCDLLGEGNAGLMRLGRVDLRLEGVELLRLGVEDILRGLRSRLVTFVLRLLQFVVGEFDFLALRLYLFLQLLQIEHGL
jgi:hypothetical protein